MESENLIEFAENVEMKGSNFKNITEFKELSLSEIRNVREEEVEFDGKKKVLIKCTITRDGTDYEVNIPWKVVKSIKVYSNKGFKFTKFEVTKSGEGKNTEYTFMPLDAVREVKIEDI